LKFTVSEYKDWLKRARSALNLSRIDKSKDIVYENLCFQAQQAAEKAIKALYIYYRIEPQKTQIMPFKPGTLVIRHL